MPRLTLAVVLASLALATPAIVGQETSAYVVIVDADSDVDQISRSELSRLFLKKVTRWVDGDPALPVDLAERSPVRDLFSQEVHGRRTAAIKSYWQRMIFSGRATPPPEVDSDEDVISYVKSHPGAIGYISADAEIEEAVGVRVVEVVEDDQGEARAAEPRRTAMVPSVVSHK